MRAKLSSVVLRLARFLLPTESKSARPVMLWVIWLRLGLRLKRERTSKAASRFYAKRPAKHLAPSLPHVPHHKVLPVFTLRVKGCQLAARERNGVSVRLDSRLASDCQVDDGTEI